MARRTPTTRPWPTGGAARERSRPRARRPEATGALRREMAARLRRHHCQEQISHHLRQDLPEQAGLRACAPRRSARPYYVQGGGDLRAEPGDLVPLRSEAVSAPAPLTPGHPQNGRQTPARGHDDQPAPDPGRRPDRAGPPGMETRSSGRAPQHGEPLTERSTRFLLIRNLPGGHDPTTVTQALTQMAQAPALRRTLTWNQDSET